MSSDPRRVPTVAVVTCDDRLTDDVRRLGAVAGATVAAVAEIAAVAPHWRTASVLLVDAAMADAVAALGLPRRPWVGVVSPGHPSLAAWQAGVRLGADRVLALPDEEREVVDLVVAAAAPVRPAGRVVAVVSGSGGAGASTTAAALAVTAATRVPVTLVDADPFGGGLDLLLGAEQVAGWRWPDLADARGALDPDAVDAALPRAAGVRLLSCARGAPAAVPAEAMAAVLAATAACARLVVVDVPGAASPAGEAAVALSAATLVVAGDDVRSAAAAATTVAWAAHRCPDVSVVVRSSGRAGIRPADVALAAAAPLAAIVATDPAVDAAAARGDLGAALRRTGLGRAAATLADALVLADGG